jgi:hypothetical protein
MHLAALPHLACLVCLASQLCQAMVVGVEDGTHQLQQQQQHMLTEQPQATVQLKHVDVRCTGM